ncbi:MAG TPA: oxygenase MpaB family protein [Nocardioidaceae bacterium]|nr:oxygenase MpaB family protein [Nocardioidaceae bacterium]
MSLTTVTDVRARLGHALFLKVAGPDGAEQRSRIHDTPGPRWFGEDRPIRRVHGDASMFIGGIRALMLQSMHPLAMAAVAAHSGFRGDPWGRIARTSRFVAMTTFGTSEDAQTVVDQVRAVHSRIRGAAADGRPYAASDPHLLRWVHVAEVDSFLRAHQAYGAEPLDQAGRDGYVADTAQVATALGVDAPPTTEAELAAQIDAFRPELTGTPQARDAISFVLWSPPLPWIARPAYGVLAAGAVRLMPTWSRRPLRLPYLPLSEATVVRALGSVATGTIRWAMAAGPAAHDPAS